MAAAAWVEADVLHVVLSHVGNSGGALLLAGCGAAEERRPNALLVTIESVRTDHVGAYGGHSCTRPEEPLTPARDAFAALLELLAVSFGGEVSLQGWGGIRTSEGKLLWREAAAG